MRVIFEENKVYGTLLATTLKNLINAPVIFLSEKNLLLELLANSKIRSIIASEQILSKIDIVHAMLCSYDCIQIFPGLDFKDFNKHLNTNDAYQRIISIIPIEHSAIENLSHDTTLDANPGKLSTTETLILRLLANGLSYKMISDSTGSALHTVKTHVRNIYKKLEVNNAAGAVKAALKYNII